MMSAPRSSAGRERSLPREACIWRYDVDPCDRAVGYHMLERPEAFAASFGAMSSVAIAALSSDFPGGSPLVAGSLMARVFITLNGCFTWCRL